MNFFPFGPFHGNSPVFLGIKKKYTVIRASLPFHCPFHSGVQFSPHLYTFLFIHSMWDEPKKNAGWCIVFYCCLLVGLFVWFFAMFKESFCAQNNPPKANTFNYGENVAKENLYIFPVQTKKKDCFRQYRLYFHSHGNL